MTAREDENWHKEVCSLAHYVCQVCLRDFSSNYFFNEKGKNQYVCGHHLQGKKAHPKLRLKISNGICTCDSADTQCHKLLEKKTMTLEQARNTVKNILSAKKASLKNDFKKIDEGYKKKKIEKFWGATKPPARMPKSTDGKKKKVKNKVKLDRYWDKEKQRVVFIK